MAQHWEATMRRHLVWLGSLALATALLVAVDGACAQPATPSQQPTDGQPAQAFEALTTTGERVSLATLRGKAVLLNFWSPT
ncbi:MAG: redoxin domain-containing protein [Luteitalea sp.]|nr:redoxin domain-containing protein [Luteitalea sp.]